MVFVIGGDQADDQPIAHCEMFNKHSNSWTTKAPLNIARFSASACTVKDNTVYVFGGYNNGRLDTIEKYNYSLNQWVTLDIRLKEAISAP